MRTKLRRYWMLTIYIAKDKWTVLNRNCIVWPPGWQLHRIQSDRDFAYELMEWKRTCFVEIFSNSLSIKGNIVQRTCFFPDAVQTSIKSEWNNLNVDIFYFMIYLNCNKRINWNPKYVQCGRLFQILKKHDLHMYFTLVYNLQSTKLSASFELLLAMHM